MLTGINLGDILFIDIETVPQVYNFEKLDDSWKELWSDKTKFLQERESKTAGDLYQRSAIYAEFGKIICISTAFFYQSGSEERLRVKSFYGKDESKLLQQFLIMIEKFDQKGPKFLCGHNSKEFDIPFIARRSLVNRLELPPMFNLAGKKPWEVNHLDTMHLWKFGDYKHFTSLKLLAKLFDVPTPKGDISGADVGRVYWEEDDLGRIKTYCEKDTIAVARLVQRFRNLEIIHDDYIEFV
ncbi:MAG: ribonuclease H-like domain-containing protein [Flavobacteriales bacterium]|nr:ribonuclease H-like domain-containing protein [Flavobacteriales bacterium]